MSVGTFARARAAAVAPAAGPAAGVAQSPAPDLPPGVFMGGPTAAGARRHLRASIPTIRRCSPACRTSATPTASSASIALSGTLTWDPAAPEKSTLSVNVQTGVDHVQRARTSPSSSPAMSS